MSREESEIFRQLEAGADELGGGRKGEKQTKRKLEERDQREQGMKQMMIDGGSATAHTRKRKSGLSTSAEEKNEMKVCTRAAKSLKTDPEIRSVLQQSVAQRQNTSRNKHLWEVEEEMDFENETSRVYSTTTPIQLSTQVASQSLITNNTHIQRNTNNQNPQKLSHTSVAATSSSVQFPVTFTQDLDISKNMRERKTNSSLQRRNYPIHRVKAQKRKRGSFPKFTANGFQPSMTERSFDSKFDDVSLSTQVLQDAVDNDSDTVEEDFTATIPSVAIHRARGSPPSSRTLVGGNEYLTLTESSCRRSS
jgi:hypothetical protein